MKLLSSHGIELLRNINRLSDDDEVFTLFHRFVKEHWETLRRNEDYRYRRLENDLADIIRQIIESPEYKALQDRIAEYEGEIEEAVVLH